MPSRRCHIKSRHGCVQCKSKRVKCNELRPHCGRCTERGLECSYASSGWSHTVVSIPRKTRPSVGATSQKEPVPEKTSNGEPGGLELQNLELMVQWCNHTHLNLSRSWSVEWIWKSAIPRKATQHSFLMHGVLAISALRCAYSSTEMARTGFLEMTQTHHSKAIAGLAQLNQLDQSNADAAYALSNIIIFTFALPLCNQPKSLCDYVKELLAIAHISKSSMKVRRPALGAGG